MSDDPMNVIQDISKQFNGKLARCQCYDANVCDTRALPDKPWVLVPIVGEPFSQELRFVHRKRAVNIFANSAYVQGMVKGTIASRQLSINVKQKIASRSHFAGTLSIAGLQYPIFTQDGRLTPDQDALIGQSKFLVLMSKIGLGPEESVHFNRDEVSFYLLRPETNLVTRVIDLAIDFIEVFNIPEDKLNLKLLPVQFHPLIPLVERWGLSDDSDRTEQLAQAPEEVLRQLIENVNPYLVAIDSYLDSFRKAPPTEEGAALGRLAECALEASVYLRDRTKAGN